MVVCIQCVSHMPEKSGAKFFGKPKHHRLQVYSTQKAPPFPVDGTRVAVKWTKPSVKIEHCMWWCVCFPVFGIWVWLEPYRNLINYRFVTLSWGTKAVQRHQPDTHEHYIVVSIVADCVSGALSRCNNLSFNFGRSQKRSRFWHRRCTRNYIINILSIASIVNICANSKTAT